MNHFHKAIVKLSGVLLTMMAGNHVACHSQVIPLENATFHENGIEFHGVPLQLTGWRQQSSIPTSDSSPTLWITPNRSCLALGDGMSISQVVSLPEMEKSMADASDWGLMLAVDVEGIASQETGLSRNGPANPPELNLRLLNPQSEQVLHQARFPVTRIAEAHDSDSFPPKIIASSFQRGLPPERVLDGNPQTTWHSQWNKNQLPHLLTLDFGQPKTLRGVHYQPRSDLGNGTLKGFRLEVTSDGVNWALVQQGELTHAKPDSPAFISLPHPVACRAFRLWFDSTRGGDRHASCAQLIPDCVEGWDWQPAEVDQTLISDRTSPGRYHLLLTAEQLQGLTEVEIELTASGSHPIVMSHVHLCHVPMQATEKMAGKANGHLGPDIIRAGSYGLTGLMIHNYPALPVIDVWKGSAAERAGVKPGDLIVAVNQRYLPTGNVAPGYDWLMNSHEAILGGAALAACRENGRRRNLQQVALMVLRNGKEQELTLRLQMPEFFTRPDFLTDPRSLKELNEILIQHVLANQRPDGSWRNSQIHTALGGLALLSTRNDRYRRQVKAAADWLMNKNAAPDRGFYWHPSFGGIFLCEYYLASGDDRVLPVAQRMLNQMNSAYHTSAWGTDTFGHGPNGVPYGNKSLVAVMVHCLVFEKLAQRCGLESSMHETLAAYLESAWSNPADGGHGALGYNASFKDLNEFWSRTGLMTLVMGLDQQRPEMRSAMVKIMRQRHPWIRNSHAYGEPGGVMGLIGLHFENQVYFEHVLQSYDWWFAMALEPGVGLHYTTPHMGAPYMEGPELINNGYALVTNLHRRSLHISGSNDRNWLDTSRLPTPLSEVLILQDAEGQVSLRSRIPGSRIHYTVNGDTPTPRSREYQQPFQVPAGTTVKAIAVSGRESSKPTERALGIDKSSWQIIDASGHANRSKSIERAKRAIDGDPLISWTTDAGLDAPGLPVTIIIDLGQFHKIRKLKFAAPMKDHAPKTFTVWGSDTKRFDENNPLYVVRSAEFQPVMESELPHSAPIRFLKIRFEESQSLGSLIVLGEIDLF